MHAISCSCWRCATAWQAQRVASLLPCSAAVASCCGAKQSTGLDTDATALHEGSYHSGSLAHTVLLAAGGTGAAISTAAATAAALVAELGDARLAAAALPIACGCSSSTDSGSQPAGLGGASGEGVFSAGSLGQLGLYSVCPRSLQGRARAWGSALNLPFGMQQTDSDYFAAPGAVRLPESVGSWLACWVYTWALNARVDSMRARA